MPTTRIRFDGPLDVSGTLAPLRRGYGDPTMRLAGQRCWRAARTPDGSATLALEVVGGTVIAETWGPGAERALEGVRDLVGLHDDRSEFRALHPLIGELDRRFPGIRIGRSRAVFEALVPGILEQKVTGEEARRTFRGLVRAFGEPAPGPAAFNLRLPPSPERLAALPYYAYHAFGLERRRADVIRRAAGRAAWLEGTVELPLPEAYARLTSLSGVGPWTTAEVAVRALGDTDAVSVGDYHLPNLVGSALVGGGSWDDARMLELLEPYRPQRARVIRLLEAAGTALWGQRRAPRMALRRIESI